MRFVVGVGNAERYRQVVAGLDPDYPYEVRQGGVAAVGAGCDAQLMMFPLAAERYAGADPRSRAAQVLVNDRGDGGTPVVVALPTLALDADLRPVTHGRTHREHVTWAITSALAALEDACGDLDGLTVLLHLEAAAMDARPLEVLDVLRTVGAGL
ncbi:hypothetical protein [Cellulomonas sp. JZ18]|uniref:hypothetical protein n=1 Tax=Cellulomonas sp. JZ18 TaxID=2654191 RepID=UPI0012D43B86|nr:hypothetical protein [Cellulomonas sp. JZ18]